MAETPKDKSLVEFTTPLQEMALVMHETYSAFVSAGFREDQAIQLILGMAEYGVNGNDWDEND